MNPPLHAVVQFRVGDIVHPHPTQVLSQLYEKRLLHGKVIAVTTDGSEPDTFLVIRVPGLSEPIIVPSERAVRAARTTPELEKAPRRRRHSTPV